MGRCWLTKSLFCARRSRQPADHAGRPATGGRCRAGPQRSQGGHRRPWPRVATRHGRKMPSWGSAFPGGTPPTMATRGDPPQAEDAELGLSAPTWGGEFGARIRVPHPSAPSCSRLRRPCLCGRGSLVRWCPPWERQAPAWHGTRCGMDSVCPGRRPGQPGCQTSGCRLNLLCGRVRAFADVPTLQTTRGSSTFCFFAFPPQTPLSLWSRSRCPLVSPLGAPSPSLAWDGVG